MTQTLATGPGYDDLNAMRDQIMRLPQTDPRRRAYKQLRQALANATEDVQATGNTTADLNGIDAQIKRLYEKMEVSK